MNGGMFSFLSFFFSACVCADMGPFRLFDQGSQTEAVLMDL